MKNSTKFSKEVQRELNKNLEIGSKISLVVGIIGLIFYITIGVILTTEPLWLEILLYIFAICFGFGLVVLISVKKTNKKEVENIINNYEFDKDFFTICSYRNDEEIANVKLYYNQIVKFKETENYYFVYQTITVAYPIEKSTLEDKEKELLKEYFKNGVAEYKSKRNKH